MDRQYTGSARLRQNGLMDNIRFGYQPNPKCGSAQNMRPT